MNNRTTIFHLNYDILQAIMLLVVASAGGGKDLAKAMAVCKGFVMFGNDKKLLMMANFEDFALPNSVEHCHHIRSLLIQCAESGNAGAQYKLAQVILFQFSQLVDKKIYYNKRQFACSNMLPPFLCYFMPEQGMISDSNGKRFTHFELVSLFLSQCSLLDHVSMLPHVQNYVEHFRIVTKGTLFYFWYNKMTLVLQAIMDVGRDRRMLFSPRLSIKNYCPIMPVERNARHVMHKIEESISYYFYNSTELSPSNWEELKRECQIIAEELLSSECYAKPLEKSAKILDIGKRFFYYLAFSGPVTREIDLALDRDGDNLRAACMCCAKNYNIYQRNATLSFDGMWVPLGNKQGIATSKAGLKRYRSWKFDLE